MTSNESDQMDYCFLYLIHQTNVYLIFSHGFNCFQVPQVGLTTQIKHYKKVNLDVNYEDTLNTEEYMYEDEQIAEGSHLYAKCYFLYMYLSVKILISLSQQNHVFMQKNVQV